MELNQETSGSTKSNMTQREKGYSETCVLRFTCPHEEHACSSMSISSACDTRNLKKAFAQGMSELCDLPWQNRCWRDWRVLTLGHGQASRARNAWTGQLPTKEQR